MGSILSPKTPSPPPIPVAPPAATPPTAANPQVANVAAKSRQKAAAASQSSEDRTMSARGLTEPPQTANLTLLGGTK